MRFIGRSFRNLVTLTLTSALAISSAIVAPSANATPAAPTITQLSAAVTGATAAVTVTFVKGDSSVPAGDKYSTDNGVTWKYCDSSDCRWTSDNRYVRIDKLSSENNAMRNGSTYQILLQACGTVSGQILTDCSGDSPLVVYTVTSGSTSIATATISTDTTIANGASGVSVTITGNDFKSGIATSDFTINAGTTGLTAGSLTFTDSTTVNIAFSGTADYGTITFQAKTSAYVTAPSGASNTVSINVPSGLPAAPTNVDSSSVTGADITLTWTAPANRAGAATTDYIIYYKVSPSGTWDTFTATASTSTSRVVSGLSSSTAYLFKVAAKNSVGIGPFSSDFGPVTTGATPTVPETPTAVSAGSATSSSLTVTWTAPGNNGGATILDYKIERSTDGTTWVSAATGASSGHVVSGLSASTSYYFRVAARNSVGYGPFSDSSTTVSTSAASSNSSPAPEVDYAPTITDVSKLKVCARGQENFVIRGNNFKNATVTIDGVQVSVKGKSDNVLNISFGETTAGKKIITVSNPAGKATIEVEFKLVDKTAFKVFDIPYIYKGGSFEYQFEAFGENTYRITGNLPDGLVLDAQNGIIYGVPTEEGKFNFVLHADGLCGNDVDVIKLDIDKAIPNAISYRIKFPNKKNKKIVGTEQFELKKFLKMVKEISPKQIEPVIYITGGAPENEPEVESTSAKDRRDSLCDIMINQDVLGQTVLGLFDGEEDEIEIFVYWPVVR